MKKIKVFIREGNKTCAHCFHYLVNDNITWSVPAGSTLCCICKACYVEEIAKEKHAVEVF